MPTIDANNSRALGEKQHWGCKQCMRKIERKIETTINFLQFFKQT